MFERLSFIVKLLVLQSFLQGCAESDMHWRNMAITQAASNKSVTMNELLGTNATMVNFWASWCAPCREELPLLIELAPKLRALNVEVLLVSVDKDPLVFDEARRDYSATQLFYHYQGPYHFEVLPQTVFLDSDGQLIDRVIGERKWSLEMIQSYISNSQRAN